MGWVPQKGTHPDVVQGGGQRTAHLLLRGRRCVTKKNLLACFLKRWEGENRLHFWKGRKASPPHPHSSRTAWGRGSDVWLVVQRVLLLWKKLAFFWTPPARSGRANIEKGLLQTAGLGLLPVDGFLTPGSCMSCTPQLSLRYLSSLHAGKPKWHLSIIPTDSRTPNALSPKRELIMLCQEMSDAR